MATPVEEIDGEKQAEGIDDSSVEPEFPTDDLDDDEVGSQMSEFARWLNKQQWVAVVGFVIGVVWLIFDADNGFRIVACSVIVAGLFPVVTGYYRSPFGALRGWQARARGLFSIGIGVMIFGLIGF